MNAAQAAAVSVVSRLQSAPLPLVGVQRANWKNLLEITPAQLRQAMRKYIDTKHFLRVIVAPGS